MTGRWSTGADRIRDRLTRRAAHGQPPLTRDEIARAAEQLRWEAVDLTRRGYPLDGDAASRFADRLDDTLELIDLRPWRSAA